MISNAPVPMKKKAPKLDPVEGFLALSDEEKEAEYAKLDRQHTRQSR